MKAGERLQRRSGGSNPSRSAKMLRIEIINDGTAHIPENIAITNGKEFCLVGNYNYKILINNTVVAKGKIKNHLRISGWQGLISCLDTVINGDRFDGD